MGKGKVKWGRGTKETGIGMEMSADGWGCWDAAPSVPQIVSPPPDCPSDTLISTLLSGMLPC